MRAARVFVDSNTILYALDDTDPAKRNSSRRWFTELALHKSGVINVKTLNEVTNVLLRKTAWYPVVNVFARIDEFAVLGVTPLPWETSHRARGIRQLTRYSWCHSLLLASALELGCTHFLSEDLQASRSINGLTIVDPFSTSPGDILSP